MRAVIKTSLIGLALFLFAATSVFAGSTLQPNSDPQTVNSVSQDDEIEIPILIIWIP